MGVLTFMKKFAILFFISFLLFSPQSNSSNSQSISQHNTETKETSPKTETFVGVVESLDNGCAQDGICSLKISGKKVISGQGWDNGPWGSQDWQQTYGPSEILGKKVEVFAKKDGQNYSLKGNKKYYIKLIK